MNIEDSAIFCSDCFWNALLNLQNLHPHLDMGLFEARYFIRHLRRRYAITCHLIQFIADNMDLAAGNSGRNASSFKSNFSWRVVAAHPLARVKQMSNNANLPLRSARVACRSEERR